MAWQDDVDDFFTAKKGLNWKIGLAYFSLVLPIFYWVVFKPIRDAYREETHDEWVERGMKKSLWEKFLGLFESTPPPSPEFPPLLEQDRTKKKVVDVTTLEVKTDSKDDALFAPLPEIEETKESLSSITPIPPPPPLARFSIPHAEENTTPFASIMDEKNVGSDLKNKKLQELKASLAGRATLFTQPKQSNELVVEAAKIIQNTILDILPQTAERKEADFIGTMLNKITQCRSEKEWEDYVTRDLGCTDARDTKELMKLLSLYRTSDASTMKRMIQEELVSIFENNSLDAKNHVSLDYGAALFAIAHQFGILELKPTYDIPRLNEFVHEARNILQLPSLRRPAA